MTQEEVGKAQGPEAEPRGRELGKAACGSSTAAGAPFPLDEPVSSTSLGKPGFSDGALKFAIAECVSCHSQRRSRPI